MKAEWTNSDSLTTTQTTKAILVIDMPKSCAECTLNCDGLCGAEQEPVHSIGCPLKPLPRRKYGFEVNGLRPSDQILIQSGWNACLEELEK